MTLLLQRADWPGELSINTRSLATRQHYQTQLRYEVSKMTLWDIFVGTMLLFLSRKVSVIQIHINNWENYGKSDFNFEVETIKLTKRVCYCNLCNLWKPLCLLYTYSIFFLTNVRFDLFIFVLCSVQFGSVVGQVNVTDYNNNIKDQL